MFGQGKEFMLDSSVLDKDEFLVSCPECGGQNLKSTKRGQIECLDCGAMFSFDKDDDSQRVLALFLYREGTELLSHDNPSDIRRGLNAINQARRIISRLLSSDLADPFIHQLDMDCLAAVYATLADYYGYSSIDPSPAQRAKAVKYFEKSLELARQVLEQEESIDHLLNVSTMIQKKTLLDEELADKEKALEQTLEARELVLKARDKAELEMPEMLGEIHRLMQGSYVLTAELYNYSGQIEKGKESYLSLVELLQKMIEEGEDVFNATAGLLFAYVRLALICDQLGDEKGVKTYKNLAREMSKNLPEADEMELDGSLVSALGLDDPDFNLDFLDQIGENSDGVMAGGFFNRMMAEGLFGADIDELIDPLFADEDEIEESPRNKKNRKGRKEEKSLEESKNRIKQEVFKPNRNGFSLFDEDDEEEFSGAGELRDILSRSIDEENQTMELGDEFFEWLEKRGPLIGLENPFDSDGEDSLFDWDDDDEDADIEIDIHEDFLTEDDKEYLNDLMNDRETMEAVDSLSEYAELFDMERYEEGKHLDELQEYLIGLQLHIANLQFEFGEVDEGLEHMIPALKKLEDFYEIDPDPDHLVGLSAYYTKMAMMYSVLEKDKESRKAFAKALEFAKRAYDDLPEGEHRSIMMNHVAHLSMSVASSHLMQEELEKAVPYLKQTIEMCEKLEDFYDDFDEALYGVALFDYGQVLMDLGKKKEGQKYIKRSKKYFNPNEHQHF